MRGQRCMDLLSVMRADDRSIRRVEAGASFGIAIAYLLIAYIVAHSFGVVAPKKPKACKSPKILPRLASEPLQGMSAFFYGR